MDQDSSDILYRTREEAIQILKAQMPLDDKIPWADFVIHNEGSLEETKKQAGDLWKRLTTRTA
jgi:dephospho-CoA kinase